MYNIGRKVHWFISSLVTSSLVTANCKLVMVNCLNRLIDVKRSTQKLKGSLLDLIPLRKDILSMLTTGANHSPPTPKAHPVSWF